MIQKYELDLKSLGENDSGFDFSHYSEEMCEELLEICESNESFFPLYSAVYKQKFYKELCAQYSKFVKKDNGKYLLRGNIEKMLHGEDTRGLVKLKHSIRELILRGNYKSKTKVRLFKELIIEDKAPCAVFLASTNLLNDECLQKAACSVIKQEFSSLFDLNHLSVLGPRNAIESRTKGRLAVFAGDSSDSHYDSIARYLIPIATEDIIFEIEELMDDPEYYVSNDSLNNLKSAINENKRRKKELLPVEQKEKKTKSSFPTKYSDIKKIIFEENEAKRYDCFDPGSGIREKKQIWFYANLSAVIIGSDSLMLDYDLRLNEIKDAEYAFLNKYLESVPFEDIRKAVEIIYRCEGRKLGVGWKIYVVRDIFEKFAGLSNFERMKEETPLLVLCLDDISNDDRFWNNISDAQFQSTLQTLWDSLQRESFYSFLDGLVKNTIRTGNTNAMALLAKSIVNIWVNPLNASPESEKIIVDRFDTLLDQYGNQRMILLSAIFDSLISTKRVVLNYKKREGE